MSAQPYVDAIKALGVKVVVEADLGFYQGDWVGLVQDDEWGYGQGRYGFIVVGYGSCSGCDAWQAADGPKQRAEAIVSQLDGSKWFDNLDEAKAYIASGDQSLKWHAHEDGWPGFVQAVQAVAA